MLSLLYLVIGDQYHLGIIAVSEITFSPGDNRCSLNYPTVTFTVKVRSHYLEYHLDVQQLTSSSN